MDPTAPVPTPPFLPDIRLMNVNTTSCPEMLLQPHKHNCHLFCVANPGPIRQKIWYEAVYPRLVMASKPCFRTIEVRASDRGHAYIPQPLDSGCPLHVDARVIGSAVPSLPASYTVGPAILSPGCRHLVGPGALRF